MYHCECAMRIHPRHFFVIEHCRQVERIQTVGIAFVEIAPVGKQCLDDFNVIVLDCNVQRRVHD